MFKSEIMEDEVTSIYRAAFKVLESSDKFFITSNEWSKKSRYYISNRDQKEYIELQCFHCSDLTIKEICEKHNLKLGNKTCENGGWDMFQCFGFDWNAWEKIAKPILKELFLSELEEVVEEISTADLITALARRIKKDKLHDNKNARLLASG